MLTLKLSTTRKHQIASCLFTLISAASHNTYATELEVVSDLPVSYVAASSSADLLDIAEGKGLEFLESAKSKGEPALCSDQVQNGLSVFQALFSFIPGSATFLNLINLANSIGTAATCRGSGGVEFTWDQIMDEVDSKIETAISELQRKQMRDLYGYFSLEFDSRIDRLKLAEKGLLSQTDILILITELSNIVKDIEQAETMFSAGNEWSQISFLPYLYTLKYNIHLVLAELYPMHNDLQQTAQNHLNLQMEQSRIRAVKGIASAYKDYAKYITNTRFAHANYRFEKGRTGFYATWKRKFTIWFYDETGKETVYTSSCNGNPCNGITANTWYDRRDRLLRDTAAALEKLWENLFETRNNTYRDFVDSANYFKGQQLFFVAGGTRLKTSTYTSHCLRPTMSSGDLTGIETGPCSFGAGVFLNPGAINREGHIDSWRVHDKTGLVINEATGLCLDLAEDKKALRLSACQYTLDPEREEKSTQEWAILEHGLLINRNTGECLNTPEEPQQALQFPSTGSRVEMQACDTLGMKNMSGSIDLDVKVYTPKRSQLWDLLTLNDCDDLDVCATTRTLEFNVPTRRAQAKTRVVLPADGIDQFSQNAVLETAVPGFTDTGFLSLNGVDDKATWDDLEIIAGLYKLTVVYQGADVNAPAAPQLKLEINGQQITDQLFLPAVAAGATASAEFAIDIPVFGNDLTISAVGSDESYLIDKVVLTPLAEE